MSNYQPQPMVPQQHPRSRALAIFLTVFFGPLGLLYWDARQAVILMVISVATFGIGLLVTWPWAIIITLVAKEH